MSLLLYKFFNSLAKFFYKAAGGLEPSTADQIKLLKELESKNERIEALRNEVYALSSKLTTANNLIKKVAGNQHISKKTTKSKPDPDDLI